jgi:hypothetical protein
MKKMITVFIALVILAGTVTTAFANPLTVSAENGRILPPSGLGLELNTTIDRDQQSSLSVNSEISYGLFSSITIAGNISNLNNSDRQTLIKAYFSPVHDDMGYTAYLGYDPGEREISQYGLSLWTDLNLAFAFLNLESNQRHEDGQLTVTPGATLRLGSKLRLAGEMPIDPDDWNARNLRLGASYALNSKILAKAAYDTDAQIFTTGISVEI